MEELKCGHKHEGEECVHEDGSRHKMSECECCGKTENQEESSEKSSEEQSSEEASEESSDESSKDEQSADNTENA